MFSTQNDAESSILRTGVGFSPFRLGSATVGLQQPGAIGLPEEKGTVHPGFLSSDMSDS